MISALQKMLQLSFEQESVQRKTKDASTYSDALQEMNKEQGNLSENFQKLISDLIDLSKQTFYLSPNLNKSLGKTQNNMQQSMSNLSERRKAQAAKNQLKAMEGLNESVWSVSLTPTR